MGFGNDNCFREEEDLSEFKISDQSIYIDTSEAVSPLPVVAEPVFKTKKNRRVYPLHTSLLFSLGAFPELWKENRTMLQDVGREVGDLTLYRIASYITVIVYGTFLSFLFFFVGYENRVGFVLLSCLVSLWFALVDYFNLINMYFTRNTIPNSFRSAIRAIAFAFSILTSIHFLTGLYEYDVSVLPFILAISFFIFHSMAVATEVAMEYAVSSFPNPK